MNKDNNFKEKSNDIYGSTQNLLYTLDLHNCLTISTLDVSSIYKLSMIVFLQINSLYLSIKSVHRTEKDGIFDDFLSNILYQKCLILVINCYLFFSVVKINNI
jgi:hypothetical protein